MAGFISASWSTSSKHVHVPHLKVTSANRIAALSDPRFRQICSRAYAFCFFPDHVSGKTILCDFSQTTFANIMTIDNRAVAKESGLGQRSTPNLGLFFAHDFGQGQRCLQWEPCDGLLKTIKGFSKTFKLPRHPAPEVPPIAKSWVCVKNRGPYKWWFSCWCLPKTSSRRTRNGPRKASGDKMVGKPFF